MVGAVPAGASGGGATLIGGAWGVTGGLGGVGGFAPQAGSMVWPAIPAALVASLPAPAADAPA
jgi:hypothetical protein